MQGNALPTLAIWGSNDRIMPVEQARWLCRLMPNARLVVLEDASQAYLTSYLVLAKLSQK